MLGTISASASVDDNNNNSVSHPISGAQYFIASSLAIQQSRSHLQWNLGYSPGLTIFVPSNILPDQFSQSFGGKLHYDVTKRFSIGLRQDYLRTNDPFQQLGRAPLQPGIDVIDRPGSVALPDLRRTSLLSGVQLDYRLAKYTAVGVTGTFMQTHYDQSSGNANSLIDTRNSSGSAFLSHQFSRRQSVGMQYQFDDLVFSQGSSRTTSHSVLLFDQIAINPHMNFSIFAGPEYSRVHNQELVNLLFFVVQVPVSKTLLSSAGGATFNWSGNHSAVQASFVRRVSDGGGLLGSVEMNDAALQIRTKLARRWVATLDGDMAQDTLLQVSGNGKMQVIQAGGGISHELARNMWLRVSYQRMRRTGGYLAPLGFGNHNRLTLSLERSFSLPLGRLVWKRLLSPST
jgi:hypothetical protein